MKARKICDHIPLGKSTTILQDFYGPTVPTVPRFYDTCGVSIYLHYAVLVVSEVDSIVVVITPSCCGNSIQGKGVIVSYTGLASS